MWSVHTDIPSQNLSRENGDHYQTPYYGGRVPLDNRNGRLRNINPGFEDCRTVLRNIFLYLKFILFLNNTVHVSDGLSVHHQESKTLHIPDTVCTVLDS